MRVHLLKRIFFSLWLMSGLAVQAQNTATIAIGTLGTSDHHAGPIYRSSTTSSYFVSRYAYLYDNTELSNEGLTSGSTITKIAWYKDNATTLGASRVNQFTIYLKNSAATTYGQASETWTVLTAGATQVFTDDITLPNTSGWVEFTLDQPFIYTGDALEVLVNFDQTSGSGNGSSSDLDWRWRTVSDRIYGRSDGSTISNTLSATSNSIGSINDRRPDIQFTYSGMGFNDIGVTSLLSPGTGTCPGNSNVEVEVRNFGINQVDTFTVNWRIDGALQTPTTDYTLLDTSGGTGNSVTTINLGSFNFVAGQTYDIEVWTSAPNNQTDTTTSNDSTITSFLPSLSGTFTIGGTSPDYNTINAFLSDIQNVGVCGPVTAEIRPGTYNETLVINAINGANATNTITFDGGDSATTTITGSNATTNATISLDGADYITFKNLSIINSKTGTDTWGIHLTNQADHNTIDACHIEVPITTSTDVVGIVASNSFTSETSAGNNANYTLVQNSYVHGGEKCIHFEGQSNANPTVGNQCINNILTQSDDYGIYTDDQDSLVLIGNHIFNLGASTADGIYTLGGANYRVEKNQISVPDWGMYFNDLNLNITNFGPSRIINNMVHSTGDDGIYLNDVDSIEVYHNTVVGEPAMQVNDFDYIDLRNNIFYSVNNKALDATDATPFGILDYNLYYSVNSTDLVEWGTNSYTDLNSWQTAQGYDANSVEGDPIFVSTTDLHIIGTIANDIGDNTVGVTEDIDGDTRPFAPSTDVDLGADEIKVLNNDAGVTSLAATCVNGDLSVSVRNYGASNLTSFIVNYSIDGVVQTPVTFTNTNLTSSVDSTVSLGPAPFVANQSYNLVFWTSQPNGVADLEPSNDSTIVNGFRTGLDGNLTIGGIGADFADMASAVDALNNFGICGNVTFEIASGTYNEQVAIRDFGKADSIYTVTFRSATGQAQDVKLAAASGSGPNYVVLVEDVDLITFEHLTFERSGTNVNGVALELDGATNVTIRNNIFLGDSTVTSSNTSGSRSAIHSSNLANEHNLVIQQNSFRGNANGIWINGIISSYATGTLIEDNTFSVGYTAIYVRYMEAPVIQRNDITRFNQTTTSAFYGINLQNISNAARIVKNTTVFNSSNGYSIRMRNTVGDVNDKVLVANNMVSQNGTTTSYGISVESNSDYIKVYHNSVLLTGGTSTLGRPFYATGLSSSNDVQVLNNLFVHRGSGYSIYVTTSGDDAITVFDHNILYTNRTNLAYWGVARNTLNALQLASSLNENDVVLDPSYIANDNLRLSSTGQDYNGTPIAEIDDDIDGNPRCTVPVKGAFEGTIPTRPLVVDFSTPDSVYQNGRATFINSAQPLDRKLHTWYVNGTEVSDELNLTQTFTNTGIQEIKLVTTGCTVTDSVTKTIDVIAPFDVPTADFIADRSRVFIDEFVQLTDLSTQAPNGWTWSVSPTTGALFTSEFIQDPQIFFSEPGVYEICLVSENGFGPSAQVCKSTFIEVFPSINMCDEASSTASQGQLFDDGGAFDVYSNNTNCSFLIEPCATSVTAHITQWDFTDVDDELRLYDGANEDPNHLLATFNANSVNPGGTAGITAASGTMLVVFKTDAGTNGDGFGLRWESQPINASLSAGFTIPDSGFINSPVFITNTATGDKLTYSFDVDYPNGVQPVESNNTISHSYTTPGTYTIQQLVNGCAGVDSVQQTIVITSPTVAPTPVDFAANRTTLTTQDVLELSDLSPNGPTNWTWEVTPATGVSFIGGSDNALAQVQFSNTGTYDIKLVVSNANGADSVTKAGFITVVDYCVPAVASVSEDLGISQVVFEGINNSSLIGERAYTDYTQSQMQASLGTGESYAISIARNNALQAMSRRVWIDWNQDGDFNDTLELVTSELNATTQVFNGTVNVPALALTGFTRMRVGTGYQNDPQSPCGPALIGEFEDYRVEVLGDITKPVITLLGTNPETVEAGFPYTDAGATAQDNIDGNLTGAIVIDSNVDTTVAGNYQVTYVVQDAAGNISNTVTRVVNVTPDATAPVVTLLGNTSDTIEVYTSYTDQGITAIDQPWGTVINSAIVNSTLDTAVLGSYTITYTASDASGNSAMVTRTVVVVDRTAPTLTLNGNDPMTVEVNSTFIDPGTTPDDNYWSPIAVAVTGTVDVTALGSYTLTYIATDGSGNSSAPITRTVNVEDNTAPVIELVGTDFISLFRWEDYDDAGYTFSDNFDPNSSIQIDTLGDWVNSGSEGLYYIQYRATDASGNSSLTAKRVIDVRGVTTSINELASDIQLDIYPNPSQGEFQVDATLPAKSDAKIIIMDLAGKVVSEVTHEDIQELNEKIDLSDAAAGTYLARIIAGNSVETRKVFISNR